MIAPRIRTHRNRTGATGNPVRLVTIAACCLAPLTLAACSSASANVAGSASVAASTSSAALPTCHAPAAPGLPHSVGSLTQADTDAYCLGVGKLLDIFLTAPSGTSASGSGGHWSQIKITDTSVLAYGNNGVMTALVGVTSGVVVGRSRGATTVTSSLPDGKTWTATIVVN